MDFVRGCSIFEVDEWRWLQFAFFNFHMALRRLMFSGFGSGVQERRFYYQEEWLLSLLIFSQIGNFLDSGL